MPAAEQLRAWAPEANPTVQISALPPTSYMTLGEPHKAPFFIIK